MDFYLADFLEGIHDGLRKVANEASIFDVKGSVFPNIESQTKWKFARTDGHLHLNDGNNVYCFHLPDGEKEEDFPVSKLDNVCIHEFGKTGTTGTVQVHKADPGMVYFTMQDGYKNPTYTFKHVTGDQWRASPKHKSPVTTQITPEEFVKGAEEAGLLDGLIKGVDSVGRAGVRGGMALGHDPLLSAGAGLAGGALYDMGKRTFYNSPEENAEETKWDRLKRYIVPSAALGLSGAFAKGTFPDYYNEFPLHRP